MSNTYIHKGSKIEAIQYLGFKNKFNIAEFFKGHGNFNLTFNNEDIIVRTDTSSVVIQPKDYVVRDCGGSVSVHTPESFDASFEELK